MVNVLHNALSSYLRKAILILIILLLGFTQVSSAIGPPTVTTLAATNITSNSATLNGLVNPNGLNTYVYFFLKTSDSLYSANPLYIKGTLSTPVNYTWTYLSHGTNLFLLCYGR